METRHLEREVKTALELALAALAPSLLIEKLATAAGLLGALLELPPDSAPAATWAREATERARVSLGEWSRWEEARRAMA
jgi:hypothetical protein